MTRSKLRRASSRKRKTSTTTRSKPPEAPAADADGTPGAGVGARFARLRRPFPTHRRRFALGLGSNLGNSRSLLEAALGRLEQALGPLTVAPLYLTEPVSSLPQPPFLNTVAIGHTALEADALLACTQRIELEFGRERKVADAPRTLDLDLLLLGDLIRTEISPHLPHPRLRARRFVLAPLCDVAPDWPIPPDGATACDLLRALPEGPWVRRLPDRLELRTGPPGQSS
ncbi:MAG: 2-amino-4-hydroxy-6-hydroxymethyldihydropteridine diphosphokinase [Thermoanaerobaculia bacterium]